MIIRKEMERDYDAITKITKVAFADMPISNQTEHFIVKALRKADALTISLVAEIDGIVVGHIAFSPFELSDGKTGWYGLGPVSVQPEFQRQGIGRALVNQGLEMLKEMGAKGCALVGDPNYYNYFGFKNYTSLIHEGIPPEFFLLLPFTKDIPSGTGAFHKAFLAKE